MAPWMLVLATTIFRCVGPDGHVEFRGMPCPAGQRIVLEAGVPSPPRGLSAEEQTALKALVGRLDAPAERGVEARRWRAEQRAQREGRCEAARRALAELRTKKRRGYPVTESRKLDAEEARLRKQLNAC